nr:MAG TPA: hypothetical protein [Herelleviridae sp.]
MNSHWSPYIKYLLHFIFKYYFFNSVTHSLTISINRISILASTGHL